MPSNLAKAAARFVEVTVFPVPPLGENTVTMRPRRVGVADGGAGRRVDLLALRMAKTTFSVICGRRRTSETSASSASSRRTEASPEASRMIGARVCSRIVAISSAGSVELRVPWRITSRCPPVRTPADSATPTLVPDELDLGVTLERVAELVEAVTGPGDEDPRLLARGDGSVEAHCSL